MKKTLALLLTLAMVFSMVLPVGAFGFETVETVAEELPAAVQSEPEAAVLPQRSFPAATCLPAQKHCLPSTMRRKQISFRRKRAFSPRALWKTRQVLWMRP